MYRVSRTKRDSKRKKKKGKKKEGKKERELENRCHRARSHVSLEVDVSLRLDSLRIHLVRPRISLEPEKRGSVPWLADPVLTQKCTQHFPRKFLIICPELPLTIELRNCKLFERKYHTLCQVGQQETGEIVTSRVFHGHWFASWSVLSQVEFIFMYRKGRIYTSLRFLESDSRIFFILIFVCVCGLVAYSTSVTNPLLSRREREFNKICQSVVLSFHELVAW